MPGRTLWHAARHAFAIGGCWERALHALPSMERARVCVDPHGARQRRGRLRLRPQMGRAAAATRGRGPPHAAVLRGRRGGDGACTAVYRAAQLCLVGGCRRRDGRGRRGARAWRRARRGARREAVEWRWSGGGGCGGRGRGDGCSCGGGGGGGGSGGGGGGGGAARGGGAGAGRRGGGISHCGARGVRQLGARRRVGRARQA